MGEGLKPAMPAVLTLPLGAGPAQFCRQLVVGKAFLNSPPPKQVTESQQALASFLARKRERYKSRLNTSIESNGGGKSSSSFSPSSVQASRSAPVELYGWKGTSNHLHESKCILRIASLDSQALYRRDNDSTWGKHNRSPQKDDSISISDDIVKLGSEELADRVVSHARLRRRNKKRTAVIQREVHRPVMKLHHDERPRVSIVRTSTPIPSNTTTPSQSPHKREGRMETRSSSLSLSRSQDELEMTESLRGTKMAARRVIVMSEKQSAVAKDTGIPNVPPPTPRAGSETDNIKIVPSMSDIKSQRELKNRLQVLSSETDNIKIVPSMSDIKSQRELKNRLQVLTMKNQEFDDKEQQQRIEKEKRERGDAINKLKMQQRAEIYALNKVMTEYEQQKFELFMSGKV